MHYGENEIGQFSSSSGGEYWTRGIEDAGAYGNFSSNQASISTVSKSRQLVLSAPRFPQEALNFPKRVADIALFFAEQTGKCKEMRALDVGTAVGRTAFELAALIPDVVGLDYSYSFVDACNRLASQGVCEFSVPVEGDITFRAKASIDSTIDRSRCIFVQGDACDLKEELGNFDLVTGANLIDRLPKPKLFLQRMKTMVNKGGFLVLTSPYTWLEQYTDKSEWIGGKIVNGHSISTLQGLKSNLCPEFELVHQSHMPFIIRETARKNQFTMAHCTVWKRM